MVQLNRALTEVIKIAQKQARRNLQMPGNPRYQSDALKPFFGYDQWAVWLTIIEWFWMETLAKMGIIPKDEAKLLTEKELFRILRKITTTEQDLVESNTKHDILALLIIIRKYLNPALHKWLHFVATSYDPIMTAYALQLYMAFKMVFWPKAVEIDTLWRKLISENADVVQAGRTHLQTALPVTVGFWLAALHNRFINCMRETKEFAEALEGKFSNAVGTYAAQVALLGTDIANQAEKTLMNILELTPAEISTQIAPPESMARFNHELVLMSGALANLGEDTRILQSSQYGEIVSASSGSSTMTHKTANPIKAENMVGMHTNILSEYQKVLLTLVSDLQRDLCGSSVMRGFPAIIIYAYQQLLSTESLLKTMVVNHDKCQANFNVAKYLVVAEPLHLALQRTGFENAYNLVNKTIVPKAAAEKTNLLVITESLTETDEVLKKAWEQVPENIKQILLNPEQYIGLAIDICHKEVNNKLE